MSIAILMQIIQGFQRLNKVKSGFSFRQTATFGDPVEELAFVCVFQNYKERSILVPKIPKIATRRRPSATQTKIGIEYFL